MNPLVTREQILFELSALDVKVNEPTIQQMPLEALQHVLIAIKRVRIMGTHWTNLQEAHKMILGEGMLACPFCHARLEA